MIARGLVGLALTLTLTLYAAAAPLKRPKPPTPVPTAEDVVLGVLTDDTKSSLLSFDPRAGKILQEHARLNPNEGYVGLAYDPARRVLYALGGSTNNLYSVRTDNLKIDHVGSLHVVPRTGTATYALGLALDPVRDALYTSLAHWSFEGPVTTEIVRVDPDTGALEVVATLPGQVGALAHDPADGKLYGLAVDGDSEADKAFVVRIDPDTGSSARLFDLPYHAVNGLAVEDGRTAFTWVNTETQFYAVIDLESGVLRPLADASPVGIDRGILYKDFDLGVRVSPVTPLPTAFVYSGVITSVVDPSGLLQGRVTAGRRFKGKIAYDAAAPYLAPDPNASAPYGLTFEVGGMTWTASGLRANVLNNAFRWVEDAVVDEFHLLTTTSPEATVAWSLYDPTARALRSNDRLPTEFDLGAWESSSFVVRGGDSVDPDYLIVGRIEAVSRVQAKAVHASSKR